MSSCANLRTIARSRRLTAEVALLKVPADLDSLCGSDKGIQPRICTVAFAYVPISRGSVSALLPGEIVFSDRATLTRVLVGLVAHAAASAGVSAISGNGLADGDCVVVGQSTAPYDKVLGYS
jgi:hypothetical protein